MKPSACLLTLLAAGSAFAAGAEPLGRLFFTPAQRALLDRQRQGGSVEQAPEAVARLDGIVARADGKTTVWINGRPQRDAGLDAAATLRVGESINRVTHEKIDVVAPGAIRSGRSGAR
ncbi:MAG: hypothetical protein PHY45_11535 [Rhodocyclaceae bacterium]|nr:hypothetical protein [Rhodocyclaceae bacterium]